MTAVMIGVDPAKRSHAMAVLDPNEKDLAALRVRNDNDGYREMLRLAKRWPQRTWAVEGAGGVGVQLAQRLVADGETVVDVPPKLATRARIFDTGHGRKNDPGDARTVAVVAVRTKGLRQVVLDDERLALRLMSERRRELVQSRTKTVNHLHQLLMELLPAGAEQKLTATKAKALLATVRPKACRRQGPPPVGRRLPGRPDHPGPQDQGHQRADQDRRRGDRHDPHADQGRRVHHGRGRARGGRRRPPLPQQASLRQLHRHSPARGLLW